MSLFNMELVEKLSYFVKEITADNSRLYKIFILEKYKEDEDINFLLNFIYNPYIIIRRI